MYVVLSFFGAAYGYFRHCSAIEAWCDAQPAGSEAQWKCQPALALNAESRALARKLGTFNAGCAAFEAGGYRFGDPQEYLHPPGHPHWARPDFANCRSCTPPVQGKVRDAWSEERGRLCE